MVKMISFFKRDKKETKCTEGAVCAWEYRGALYKSKKERDKAEAYYNYNEKVSALAKYLEEAPRNMNLRGVTEVDGETVYMCENSMGDSFFLNRKMTSSEVANKLVSSWVEIRDHIDSIVRGR